MRSMLRVLLRLPGVYQAAAFLTARRAVVRGPSMQPALAPGEPGRNERHGVIDTHGGTSQLTPDDVDDLIAFLLSL